MALNRGQAILYVNVYLSSMTPYMASVGHDLYDKNNISLYDN